jgi:hypothetical protein
MGEEFDALLANNGTWSLCPKPSNHNIICNRRVYKIKQRRLKMDLLIGLRQGNWCFVSKGFNKNMWDGLY